MRMEGVEESASERKMDWRAVKISVEERMSSGRVFFWGLGGGRH